MELLKQVRIEVRMSHPCFDRFGNAREASIYGTNNHDLCISPALMVKRLNESNVERETAALIVHELSHFFDTTEPEAEALQTIALNDLSDMSHAKMETALQSLLGPIGQGKIKDTLVPLEFWIQDPAQRFGYKDCFYWTKDLRHLKDSLNNHPHGKVQFISRKLLDLYQPQNLKIGVIYLFLTAHDRNLAQFERDGANEVLERLFGTNDTKTAREIYNGLLENAPGIPAIYDSIIIHRPRRWTDIQDELKKHQSYLLEIYEQVQDLASLNLTINQVN